MGALRYWAAAAACLACLVVQVSAVTTDTTCFTCITFNMAKRAKLMHDVNQFCQHVGDFVGAVDFPYSTQAGQPTCADITANITTDSTQPDYFKEPAFLKCIALQYCENTYGESLNVPNTADFSPRQKFVRDIIDFRAQFYQLPNDDAAGMEQGRTIVQNAGLTINFDCGIAHLLKVETRYKTGWELGNLNSDFNEACGGSIVGQSRYQKEVWGMQYYGTIQGASPRDSWATHHEYVQDIRNAVWMTDAVKKERPKYAGVNLHHFIQGYNPFGAGAYGKCVFHLNPSYRDYATLTSQDTLALGCIDADYNNEKFSCLATFEHPDAIFGKNCYPLGYQQYPPQTPPGGFFVTETLDRATGFTGASVFNVMKPDTNKWSGFPTYEAQIHAQVPLDAAHIDKLACDFRTTFGTETGLQVLALAELRNIPLVFYYQNQDIQKLTLRNDFGRYDAVTPAAPWLVRELPPMVCTGATIGVEGCLYRSIPGLETAWIKARELQASRVDPKDEKIDDFVAGRRYLAAEQKVRLEFDKLWKTLANLPGLTALKNQLAERIRNTKNPFLKIHYGLKKMSVNKKIAKGTKQDTNF